MYLHRNNARSRHIMVGHIILELVENTLEKINEGTKILALYLRGLVRKGFQIKTFSILGPSVISLVDSRAIKTPEITDVVVPTD